MRLLPAFIANLVLAVAAIGFGDFLRFLVPKTFSRLDRTVATLVGGLGVLGTILFCVGLIWFSRSAIVLVLVVGILLSFRPLGIVIRECRPVFAKVSVPVLPAGAILIVLLITTLGGFALPMGDTNNDAVAYHYLAPKVWLREAVIRPVPDEIQTFFPVVVETQYAALMSVGGPRAPEFFSVICLGCLLLTTASLAIRLGLDPTGAWWAAALVAAMPATYRGVYGGFVDALFASFVLAAARMAFDSDEPKHFALFGIFCGITLGTKYQGIIAWALLVGCSFLVSIWTYRRKMVPTLQWLGISCAVTLLVSSPFYLRNWILSGSPIYPAPPSLLKLFSLRYMQTAAIQTLVAAMVLDGRGMGGGIVNFLLLPFHLTYHTSNFRGAGGIGLAPLALGPLGMIARRRDPFTKGILLFAFLQVSAWFATAQVARYMIQVYVIGAILGVLGWKYAADIASRNGRVLSHVVIAISILYGLWMNVLARVDDVHAAVSSSYEDKRWDQETPHAASFDYINHEATVKKVLVLDPAMATYFIDKPYIKPFGRWGERTLDAQDVPQVLALLPSLHATHIVDVVEEGGSFALPEHPSGLTLVFEREDQRIYRID